MYKIKKAVYGSLISTYPDDFNEIGGVLGGNNNVISEFVFVKNTNKFKRALYTPDSDYFNFVIEQWEMKNIEFYGIFHTHPLNERTLSYGDKEYIKKIMVENPKIIKLLFPLVFNDEILFSSAEKINSNVIIYNENVIVV